MKIKTLSDHPFLLGEALLREEQRRLRRRLRVQDRHLRSRTRTLWLLLLVTSIALGCAALANLAP